MLTRGIGWLLAVSLLAPAMVRAQAQPEILTVEQRKERAVAAGMDLAAIELVALEKEMGHAMLLRNPSFFQRVYSDDYHGAASSGEVLGKDAVVARIQSSTTKYYTFVVSDIAVRVYGPSAVVTCTWSARGEQNAHTFARQYRIIHVYVYNKVGGWKVVAGQETMLPG